MIYLASPYSDKDPAIMQRRFEAVEKLTAKLMRDGLPVFSPIVHSHALAHKYNLPTDFAFWQSHCLTLLSRADYMLIYTLPGWEKSTGISGEIDFCKQQGIPVHYHEHKPDPEAA